MKIKIALIVGLIIGLFIGLLATGIAINLSGENILFQEIESPFDYEKTVRIMQERITSMDGWHIIKVFDYDQEVQHGGGQPIGKYTIIEFCNSKTAAIMLQADERKKVGAMLPKRFAIYEKDDGKVYIGAGNGPIMLHLFRSETRDIAEKVSLEVQSILLFKTNQL
ncbi:DUF302 domain-containing protein [bacterium]|nr:DUF302 domain-containing protein [bacterium]